MALFEKAKSSFKAIPGLDQPFISMKQILDEFVEVRLCEAERITIAKIDELVVSPIQRLSKTDIQRGPNSGFVVQCESELIRLFESKSNELYRNASSINPTCCEFHKANIKGQIRSRADKAYLDRVVREILPDERRTVLHLIKTRLNQAASNISPQFALNYSFSQMKSQYQSMGEQEFKQKLRHFGDPVSGTSEYQNELSQLQRDIQNEVSTIETKKRNEHNEWQRKEKERQEREREERERQRLARERLIAEAGERERQAQQRRLEEQQRKEEENQRTWERLREQEAAVQRAREEEIRLQRRREEQAACEREQTRVREAARRREMEAALEQQRRYQDSDCLLL
jgi:hypothetical protein